MTKWTRSSFFFVCAEWFHEMLYAVGFVEQDLCWICLQVINNIALDQTKLPAALNGSLTTYCNRKNKM